MFCDQKMTLTHIPVLTNEVVCLLNPKPGGIYLDATVGAGGHSEAILKTEPNAIIYGFDIDEEAIKIARKNLSRFLDSVKLYNVSYTKIPEILTSLNIKGVSGILADFGVSSIQLDNNSRGFSFQKDAPLDMRMDKRSQLTADVVVNTYPEEKLVDIFYNYGDEKLAKKIASKIVKIRQTKKILTTKELVEIIVSSYPNRYYRIHPATRVFQALRIYINNEIENIKKFLGFVPDILEKTARLVVISYHSGEDRVVKQNFIYNKKRGVYKIITKKPITPAESEIKMNKRARSAKLRCAEKIDA